MTRSEIAAYNAGIVALAALAAAAADRLAARLEERPTRYAFAIEALDSIVEGATELLVPLPPDDSEPFCNPLAPAPVERPELTAGGVD